MDEAQRKHTRVRLSKQLDGHQIVHVIDALRHARMGDLEIDVQDVGPIGAIHFEILLAAITTWKADGYLLDFINPTSDFIDGLEAAGVAASAPIQTGGVTTRLSV